MGYLLLIAFNLNLLNDVLVTLRLAFFIVHLNFRAFQNCIPTALYLILFKESTNLYTLLSQLIYLVYFGKERSLIDC